MNIDFESLFLNIFLKSLEDEIVFLIKSIVFEGSKLVLLNKSL